jgi:hypothetical protein
MGLYDQYLAESGTADETGSDQEPETQYARYLRKKKETDTVRSDAAKPAPGSVRSLLQPLPGAQDPEAVAESAPVSSAPWMISGRSSGTAQSRPATRVPAAPRGPVMAPADALNAYDDTPSFEKRLAEARDRDPDAALRDLQRPSPEDEGITPRFANKLVGVANLAYTGVRALGHAVAPLAQGMAEFFPDVGIAGAQAAMGNTQPAKDLIRGTTLRPIEQALELGNAAKNRLFGDVPTDFTQKPAVGGGSYTEGALRNYDVGPLHVRGDLTGLEAVQNAIDVYFAKGLVEHGLSSPANWIDRRAAFRAKADAADQAPIDRAYNRAQPAIEGKKLWADEEAGNARAADAAQAYGVTPSGIAAVRRIGSGYYEMPGVQEPTTDPSRILPARAASLNQPSQINNRFGSVSGDLQGPAIPLPAKTPEVTPGIDPARVDDPKVLPGETPETIGKGPDTDFDFGANVEDKNGGNENGSNRRGNSRIGFLAPAALGVAGGAAGYAAAPNDHRIAGAIGGVAGGVALALGAFRAGGEVGGVADALDRVRRYEPSVPTAESARMGQLRSNKYTAEPTAEPTIESARQPWETPQPERFSNRTGAVGDVSEKGTGSPLGSNRKRAPVAGAEDPTAMPPEPAKTPEVTPGIDPARVDDQTVLPGETPETIGTGAVGDVGRATGLTSEHLDALGEELRSAVDFGAGRDDGRLNYEAQDVADTFTDHLRTIAPKSLKEVRSAFTEFARDSDADPEHIDVVRDALDHMKPEDIGLPAERSLRNRTGAVGDLSKLEGTPAPNAGEGKTKGQPRGFAALPVVAGLAGAGAGSLANKDHPIAGALIGGLAGFTLGHKLMAPDRKSIKDGLAGTINAAGRSDDARMTANTLRVTGGEMARTYEQAHEAMKGFSAAAAKLPAGERLTFINDIETGAPHGTSLKAAGASIIRKTLDTERNKIIALGTGKLQNFIVNYFPHIWEDPNSAGTMLERVMGKRPLEGSKNFLKQRTIPTTLEGMFPKGVPAGLDAMSEAAIRKEVMAQKGLMPVTMNPVDLSLLKLREMQRYLQAHETLGELISRGIARLLAMGENIPPGFERLNDKVASGYIAPKAAARVFNNYLSPGLAGNALYDAVRGYGNALNAAQLGLSAFHLGFTSMDAAVSRMALGIEQMAAGDGIAAIKSIASTPAAPVTNFLKGRKLKDAYLRPGSMGADMEALSQALEMAGGRVKQDSFYRNSAPEKMIEAWRSGEKGKAASLALPSLFEYAARPIMEHVVPAQKLGVFADLAKHEMSKWTDATPMEERVESMRKVWDSVDNRLGQLVYDNLFWDKTFKDLAMVSTRSVGWNVGTIREIGGGIMDTGKQLNSLRKGGKAELTHRMAYIAALPITVGMAGAVTQYLYTGTGPESTKDYFSPRTGTYDVDGNPNRVQLPSYMKDVNAYESHPWQTIKHKLNPGIGSIAAMLNNEDFYGDNIRNESDPYTKQMLDNVRYLAKETLPLGVRNWQESEKRDATWKEKAAGFVGVTAANRGTTRSPAQNLMNELLPKQGARSPDMKQAQTDRGDILRQMREGKDAGDEINAAVSRGNVTARQLRRIQQRSGTLPMIENFKRLSLEDAMRVYDAGDAREQGLWNSALNAKIARAGRP